MYNIDLKTKKMSSKDILSRTFLYIFFTVEVCLVLFPLVWTLLSSLKPTSEIFKIPITWIPEKFTFQHYLKILSTPAYLRYFFNTFYVSFVSTFIVLVIAALCGYGFSRFKIKGKKIILTFILTSQMFPPILFIIPYFNIIKELSLYNTYTALIITRIVFILPFAIWMLKAFFDSLPIELEEAAMMDGCSRMSAFVKITLPLSIPGIASMAIFSFIRAWNEFLFSLTLTSSDSMKTITVGLTGFLEQYEVHWDLLMAMSLLSVIPPIIIFITMQEYFIRGLTAGGLKE